MCHLVMFAQGQNIDMGACVFSIKQDRTFLEIILF